MGKLHTAAKHGDLEAVERLLKRGTSPDARDAQGYTPLLWASQEGALEVVKCLLQAGASLELGDREGFLPLEVAATHGHLEVVKALLEAGARLDTQRSGFTPLHAAAASGQVDIARILIDAGMDIQARDEDGEDRTALHWAVQENALEVVALLLSRGAAVDQPDESGLTPLAIAAAEGWETLTRRLLEAGAAPDQAVGPQLDGTALHMACAWGQTGVAECLLRHGADPGRKNAEGLTPLEVAVRGGHTELVARLRALLESP